MGVERYVDSGLALIGCLLVELLDRDADIVRCDVHFPVFTMGSTSASDRPCARRTAASSRPATLVLPAPRTPRCQPDGKRFGKVFVGMFARTALDVPDVPRLNGIGL